MRCTALAFDFGSSTRKSTHLTAASCKAAASFEVSSCLLKVLAAARKLWPAGVCSRSTTPATPSFSLAAAGSAAYWPNSSAPMPTVPPASLKAMPRRFMSSVVCASCRSKMRFKLK